jgi:uncharacterized membrane protein YgaE (UPF0421/DUF939 family)
MLAAIKMFFSKKLFSTTGIFISILIAIVAVFIFFNSNVILSKFGFETTTTLKAELVRTQEELKKAKEINDNLNKTIENLKNIHENEVKTIVEFYKEKEIAKDTITTISKKKEIRDREIIKKIDEKLSQTETTITVPIIEYNQLSESNIDALNEVYNSFFKDIKASTITTTSHSII